MKVVLRGMSEKKEVKSGRKTVIALLIVIVVLAASLGGVFYYFTSVVNAKNSTISSLTLENENLNKTVRDLEDRLSTLNTLKEDVQRHVDELTKERETLRTQISSLQTQISSLEKERNDLMSQVSSLEKERDSLRSQVSSLQSQISSLQAQIPTLERERDNLRSQLSSLQSRLSELEDIVNLRKTTALEKDRTVNLPAGGDITLSYSTPYAGYITVTFTASGPVYFWVGSSFTGGYYMRYPIPLRGTFDTATSGTFTAPVYPGTTNIYINHPALLIGATVTFTITYTY